MQPRASKRKQYIKRILINSFMTLSVIVIATLLMLAVLGYSFNKKDNRLEQGGLLQFSSQPKGATVTLDQVELGSHTPSRTTADASTHTVTMNLIGYRTWEKTIDLHAGQVAWLSYARLVPVEPKVEKLRTVPALAGALASPDNKWFALLEDANKPSVTIANLQNDDVTYQTLTVPESLVTVPTAGMPSGYSLDSWSHDGRYLLMKHLYDNTKTEWLVIDREDVTKTQNISTSLAIVPDKVLFGAENGRTLYVRTDKIVRKVDLGSQTLSRALVMNDDDFSVYHNDTLLYTTLPDSLTGQRTVGYINDGMSADQTLATYPNDNQPIHIAIGNYFSNYYVATTYGTLLTVKSGGSLPQGTNKGSLQPVKELTLRAAPNWLTMSTDSRFVEAQTAGAYTTYDVDLQKTDATTLKGTPTSPRQLRWIDPFMTWSDYGGMLRLYEFDGANQQNLVPVAEGYDLSLSPSEKYLYSISHDASGFSLQRVQMILN